MAMSMLAERLIPATIIAGRIVPGFLGPPDLPWLATLTQEVERFCGRPMRELEERLAAPLPCAAPPFKRRAATAWLARWPKAHIQ